MDEIIISGFGGQGVISLGKFIALIALKEGRNVTYIPSYGVEVRGGTANCTVIYSEEEIASPIVESPSTVFAMNAPSVVKFVPRMKKGGTLIYNSSLITSLPPGDDIVKLSVPANEIAISSGDVQTANVVMLGVYIGLGRLSTAEKVSKMFEEVLKGREGLVGINRRALMEGGEYLRGMQTSAR